jgi:hypothetical protein
VRRLAPRLAFADIFSFLSPSMNTKYHPSLFKRARKTEELPEVSFETKQAQIPQNTLYEEPLLSQRKPSKKFVTVYGFSPENLGAVMERVKACGNITEVEHGKNWINILYESEECMMRCLRLNACMVEDEIIGAFRQSGGVLENADIFVRKKGIFTVIMEYLFGS